MQMTVNGKTYSFTDRVRQDDAVRESFFELARQTFGLDFAPWYDFGGWGDNYIPHALLLDGKVVANVSVNTVDFRLDQKSLHLVQLGTVMTHPDHRGQGLSAALMREVLSRWQDRCDGIYLFANGSVLDFYPRFGFVPAQQYAFSAAAKAASAPLPLRPLDPHDPSDKALLGTAFSKGNPYSRFEMKKDTDLFWFYLTGPLCNGAFLLPDGETVLLLEEDGDDLTLYDVLGPAPYSFDEILSAAAKGAEKPVRLGFTPIKDTDVTPDPEHLFVLQGKTNPMADDKLLFPLISIA